MTIFTLTRGEAAGPNDRLFLMDGTEIQLLAAVLANFIVEKGWKPEERKCAEEMLKAITDERPKMEAEAACSRVAGNN